MLVLQCSVMSYNVVCPTMLITILYGNVSQRTYNILLYSNFFVIFHVVIKFPREPLGFTKQNILNLIAIFCKLNSETLKVK